jgi:hypothetical protein
MSLRRAGRRAVPAASFALLLPLLPAAEAAPRHSFERELVASIEGPAFGTAGDLDGDGRDELVISVFGRIAGTAIPNGSVVAYSRDRRNGGFRATTVVPADKGVRFPNEPVLDDVDGDGDLDVITPGGFFICPVQAPAATCGYLAWWEQRPDGSFVEHEIVANGAALFYHRPLLTDLDRDGSRDMVIVGENVQGAVLQVFPGTAAGDRFEKTPVTLGVGGGSLPVLHDVDGDGVLDIFSGQFFQRDASAVWFKQIAPPTPLTRFGTWTRYVVSADLGGVIQVAAVPDMVTRGRVTYLVSNHTNTTTGPPGTAESALYELIPGADPRTPWGSRRLSEGIVSRGDACNCGQQAGAPGVFGTGDVDQDGRLDVVLSGDGDARVFWLRNLGGGEFETVVVAQERGQAGGAVVADTDGDGRPEVLFTSYEAGTVELFRLRQSGRKAQPVVPPVPANPVPAAGHALPATGVGAHVAALGLAALGGAAAARRSAGQPLG